MRLDVDRFAAVVASTIKSAMSGLTARVVALEQRQVRDGVDGAVGPMGPQGEKGADGAPGRDGLDGEPGLVGPVGPIGPSGDRGEKGADGAPGRDGRDGQAGIHGEKGMAGADGRDGIDGRDGVDGKDALGFDDIHVEHDGERGFTFKFIRGDQTKTFGAFIVPVMIHRGVWKSVETYTYQDVTTRDGSQWVCMDPSKKGTPGAGSPEQTGWVLVVKRGDVGKPGPIGKEGPTGKTGPQGPQGRNGY